MRTDTDASYLGSTQAFRLPPRQDLPAGVRLPVSKNRSLYFALKRYLDVLLATFLLVALAPLLVLVGILIKLDSPGPIIFVQQRVGSQRTKKNGAADWEIQAFRFYKFRSMYDKADQSVHKAYTEAFIRGRARNPNLNERIFKLTQDQRVTRVGRILRRTSLDELPQLLNVLKGEMSLVGPRPVPTYEVTEYRLNHWQRLAAKPGLTGLWQTKGRCRVDFEGMVRMDIEYIQKQSLWLDLKILVQSIPAVLFGKGAE
jgi:lipopolysaccharide/colanic/teichoic acid biosynthesis glycosyltransferase